MELPQPLRLTSLQSRVHHPVHAALCAALARRLGSPVEPVLEGDWREVREQFRQGQIHLGTLCSPYYLADRALPEPNWEVLAALAPSRYADQPFSPAKGAALYTSSVVVREDSPAQAFEDLRGSRFGFNEPMSLSGYHSMRIALAERGDARDFFGVLVETGGHRASLRALRAGEVDAVALDSTVEDYFLRYQPDGIVGLRNLGTLGPYPHPPLVAHTDLAPALRERIRAELVTLHQEEDFATELERFDFARLVPLQESDFRSLKARLARAKKVRIAPERRSLGRAFTGCA